MPLGIRRAAGMGPGDTILFQVVEPGRFLGIALPRHLSMTDVVARFGAQGTLDPAIWDEAHEDMVRDVLHDKFEKGGKHD